MAALNPLEFRGSFSDKRIFSSLFSNKRGRQYLDLETGGLEGCVAQYTLRLACLPRASIPCRVVASLSYGGDWVVATFLRIGNGSAVDNFHSHGLVTKPDPVIEAALYDLVDRNGQEYPPPVTGGSIRGFAVPCRNPGVGTPCKRGFGGAEDTLRGVGCCHRAGRAGFDWGK